MFSVAFLMDLEEGHLLPSFALAHSLLKAGYRVYYISVEDNEELIVRQGFEFHAIFKERYPRGYRDFYKANNRLTNAGTTADHYDYLHEIMSDSIMQQLPVADLYIVSYFLRIEGLLLQYKYGIRMAVLTPFLRAPGSGIGIDSVEELMNMPPDVVMSIIQFLQDIGRTPSSFYELVAPLEDCYEFITCVAELEPDYTVANRNVYLGPCIREQDSASSKILKDIVDRDKKLIYVSMGSQMTGHREFSDQLLQHLRLMMIREEMAPYQVIFSRGTGYDGQGFTVEQNGRIVVCDWVPQVEVLKMSTVAVVHGGLGTIKECIYYGVPMIVCPFVRDQPLNAARIEKLNLGVSLNLDAVSGQSLSECLLRLSDNELIRGSIEKMRNVFMEAEHNNDGVRVIQQLLSV